MINAYEKELIEIINSHSDKEEAIKKALDIIITLAKQDSCSEKQWQQKKNL